MKRVLVLCALLAVAFPSVALAQDPPKELPKVEKVDLTGAWDLSIETPQGSMAITANYKQDGEKLTGTQTSPMGEDKLEGTVKGQDVAYVMVFNMQGQEITISYTGKVEGDSIAGTVEFGSFGSSTWSAKRKK